MSSSSRDRNIPFLPSRPDGSTLITPSAIKGEKKSKALDLDRRKCFIVCVRNLRMHQRTHTHRLLPHGPHGRRSPSSPSTGRSEKKQRGKQSLLRQRLQEFGSYFWKLEELHTSCTPPYTKESCPVMTIL